MSKPADKSPALKQAIIVIEDLCKAWRGCGVSMTLDAYLDAQHFLNTQSPMMVELLDIVEASIPEVAAARTADIEEDEEEFPFLRFRSANGTPFDWTEEELFSHISSSLANRRLLRKLYDKGILSVHDVIQITEVIKDEYYFKGEYCYDVV